MVSNEAGHEGLKSNELSMVFAKRLTVLLKKKGLTVVQLSKQTGIPSKTLYHWKNGQKPTEIGHIIKIVRTLGVSVEQLFSSEEISPRSSEVVYELVSLKLRSSAGSEIVFSPCKFTDTSMSSLWSRA